MQVYGSLSENDLTFREQRGKLTLLATGPLVLAALGTAFLVWPSPWRTHLFSEGAIQFIGWIDAAFGLLGLIVAALSIVRPTTVRLTPGALIIKSMWRTYSRPWAGLSDFRIWTIRGAKLVVFNDSSPRRAWLANFNRTVVGATSAIPPLESTDPTTLLEALCLAKERWSPFSALSE